MTKIKPFGSRLISLLLALAVIAAFIPMISVTAAASGNAYITLRENEPKYSLDEPWYWDGQTLYLYGSYDYSYDRSGNGGENGASYFEIESSNDDFHPTVLVSNSISMALERNGVFVYSENDITIRGAGMITATGTGTLFSVPDGTIDYYGGAILSDDALTVFDADSINYCKGYVNAPKGEFYSADIHIADGYIVLDSMTTDISVALVDINKGFVDLQTLMSGNDWVTTEYKYRNCVIRSQDASADITDSNSGSICLICDNNDSVMYLPKMDNIGWLKPDDIPNVTKRQVDCGGYVFCNQILTDANRGSSGQLNGGENGVDTDLQGVFYYSTDSTAGELYLDNLNFNNSGSLFICDRSLYASGVTAEEATLAVIAHSESFGGAYLDDYNSLNSDACSNSYGSCTLVTTSDITEPYDFHVEGASVNNCNVYLGTSGYLGVNYRYVPGTSATDISNSYYAPTGVAQISDKFGLNRYADYTAKSLAFSNYNSGKTPVICGNVYADEYVDYSDPLIFDGSDAYDVCINSVPFDLEFSDPLSHIHEYNNLKWSCWFPSQSTGSRITYSGRSPIYVGKRVLSPVAGQSEYNDPLTVSPGLPAKITVPLTYPFEKNDMDKIDISLHDEDGNYSLKWSDVGVDVTIPDSTGKKEFSLILTANENVKAGTYFFYLNFNGGAVQSQGGTKEIFFNVSETSSHTMAFTHSANSWPYVDSNCDLQTFTAADYENNIDAYTWSWDGGTKTLTLKEPDSFVTSAGTGIIIEGDAAVNVDADWKISAGNNAIYSLNGDLTVNGSKNGGNMRRLTLNTGISSDYNLNISHMCIDVLPGSACSSDLLTAYNISLNECELTANDNWNGKYAINAITNYTLRRDVVLDIPASKLYCGYSAYIADIESADNIKFSSGKEIAKGSAYEIDNSNPRIPADALVPIDGTKRMKLSTKKFTVNSSNAVMYDEAVSSPDGENPEYKLLGGKQYRLDLSDFISIDYKDCDFVIDSASSSTFAGKLITDVFSLVYDADGRPFLAADIPNSADGSITLKIGVCDNKQDYSSQKTKELSVIIGGVVKTDKIGFYHEGSYDMPAADHYTVSAEYNGKPLQMTGTGADAYYLVPSGEYFDITLIPDDDYRFDIMKYGTGSDTRQWPECEISPNGVYHLLSNGDGTVYLGLNRTSEPQYVTLSLSADLQKDLADGKISSVTLKYSNGITKTFDSTSTDFSVIVLNNAKVSAEIAVPTQDNKPKYGVKSINGVIPELDDDTLVYSGDISVNGDTYVTVDIGELCGINVVAENIMNPGEKVYVKDAPENTLGQYYVGTEYEILAKLRDQKLYGNAEFNKAEIKPASEDSDGRHFMVTPVSGDNEFYIYYIDVSILRIAKPENGTVTFGGRLDNGRSVSTLSDGTQVYSIGSWDDVTLTLTPDTGYQLRSALLNGNEIAVNGNTCTFSIEQCADWSFAAEFEKLPADSFTVTVNSGANGTVTPGTKSYESGTEVTLTVTPDSGYRVKSVTVDGVEAALTDGRYTFTVTADCTFAAEFEKIPADSFTVTVNSGANGTVTPGTKSYESGTEVTLTVTPDSGYRVKSVTVDGVEAALTDGRYTFTVTADCTFAAEFEKIPADSFTVTVNSGANGTVTPGTKSYESGTEVTLTVIPDSGYRVKSVTIDGVEVALTDGRYTFTVTADCAFAAEFEKKPSSGGSSGGQARPSRTESTVKKPMLNGMEQSWTDIESTLDRLNENNSVQINLNGETTVPADIIRVIMERKLRAEFIVDSTRSWIVSGERLNAAAAADLSLLPGNADKSTLRGVSGADLRVAGTGIPADLRLSFRREFAGQFANVYKLVGREPVFQGCVKVAADGSAIITGAEISGEYIVMVCEYSDVPGDADNNGILNALDAAALLKEIVGISESANPLMCDFNGDGAVNALDAAAILKSVVGTA